MPRCRACWAALDKCAADTALRDINDLLAGGVRGMSCVSNRQVALVDIAQEAIKNRANLGSELS